MQQAAASKLAAGLCSAVQPANDNALAQYRTTYIWAEALASGRSGASTGGGDLRSPALPCQGISPQQLARAEGTRLAVTDIIVDIGPKCLQVSYGVRFHCNSISDAHGGLPH